MKPSSNNIINGLSVCCVVLCLLYKASAQEQVPVRRAISVPQTSFKTIIGGVSLGSAIGKDLSTGNTAFSIGFETASVFTQKTTSLISLNYLRLPTTESRYETMVNVRSKANPVNTSFRDADVRNEEGESQYWLRLAAYSHLDAKGKFGFLYGIHLAYLNQWRNKSYRLKDEETKKYVLMDDYPYADGERISFSDTEVSYKLKTHKGVGFGAFVGLMSSISLSEQFDLVPTAVVAFKGTIYDNDPGKPEIGVDIGVSLRYWL